MPVIHLSTEIRAPQKTCFDLARSIDFHIQSSGHTQELAVAGIVTGLIGMNEEVTFRAKHFGIWLSLTSHITAFNHPTHFRDSMKRGPFKRFDHDHFFESKGGITIMRDLFSYNSPLGILGNMADQIFLKHYLTTFLTTRNLLLKTTAETNPDMFLPAR